MILSQLDRCCDAGRAIVAKFGKIGETPRSHNREWAHASAAQKMGKMPIYWETRVKPGGDDDY